MSQMMRGSRLYAQEASLVDTPPQVDKTLDVILCTQTGRALEHISPEAAQLVAEMVTALHERQMGRASALAGHRPASYRREQLRGAKPITAEDEAQLALQAPADLTAYVRPLLNRLCVGAPEAMAALLAELAPLVGLTVAPIGPTETTDAIDAALDYADASQALANEVVRDAKDGHIDEDHSARLRRAEAELVVLKNKLATAERVRARLAERSTR